MEYISDLAWQTTLTYSPPFPCTWPVESTVSGNLGYDMGYLSRCTRLARAIHETTAFQRGESSHRKFGRGSGQIRHGDFVQYLRLGMARGAEYANALVAPPFSHLHCSVPNNHIAASELMPFNISRLASPSRRCAYRPRRFRNPRSASTSERHVSGPFPR